MDDRRSGTEVEEDEIVAVLIIDCVTTKHFII